MKKPFNIHPFLFAIYPVLFLYSHNIHQISFPEILAPAAIVSVFTLFMVLLLRRILRDNHKADIVVSFFLILFFSYGRIYYLVQGRRIWGYELFRHQYLLPLAGALVICAAYLVIKTRKNMHYFTRFLNITVFSAVIISLINIVSYELIRGATWREYRRMEFTKFSIKESERGRFKDIYYIILDGYAASSTLKEIYGYDNSEFTDYLRGKGFYVASESLSNYATTFLSLASSLNMEYINYLTDIAGVRSKDTKIPDSMIKNSRVMNYLKAKGYTFIHFSSGWGATDSNRYADMDINCGIGSEFHIMLIRTTMLCAFDGHIGFMKTDARKRILNTFSRLAEIHKIRGHKFVFAHIMAPHPPYLFGADGEHIPEERPAKQGFIWHQKESYLNQLIFINKKTRDLVDGILAESEVLPVIILQADHGTASTFLGGWKHPDDIVKERMKIFNAYYLPEVNDELLYDSISPVNTFRVIFNAYFGTRHKLLEDRSYFSGYEYPYRFVDVTEKAGNVY